MAEDDEGVKKGQDPPPGQSPGSPAEGVKPEEGDKEKFVPYDRFQEVIQERNTERDASKEQITSMQTRIQELEGQVAKPVAPTTSDSPEAIISKMSTQELHNAEIVATDTMHEKYEEVKPHLLAIKQEIRKRERNEVTNTLFSQDQKRQSEGRAFSKYSQAGIGDTKSEFYLKTKERLGLMMNTLRQAGVAEEQIKNIPTLLEDAADRAALELGIQANEAAASAQLSEYDRAMGAKAAGADMGKQTPKGVKTKPVITDTDRYMSQMFGTDAEKAAEIKQGFLKDGFAEMEEK